MSTGVETLKYLAAITAEDEENTQIREWTRFGLPLEGGQNIVITPITLDDEKLIQTLSDVIQKLWQEQPDLMLSLFCFGFDYGVLRMLKAFEKVGVQVDMKQSTTRVIDPSELQRHPLKDYTHFPFGKLLLVTLKRQRVQ